MHGVLREGRVENSSGAQRLRKPKGAWWYHRICATSVYACGWRSQYVYHFFPWPQTLSDDISMTKMIHTKLSPAAVDWGTVPQLKSNESLLWIILVTEKSSLKV